MKTTQVARSSQSKRRSLIAAAAAALALALALTAGAAAEAAVPGRLNPALLQVTHIAGTDCDAHVSMWLNTSRYPGTGAYVTCSVNRSTAIAVEADWAPVTGGKWQLWGQSAPIGAGYGTPSLTVNQAWPILGGQRQWRGDAHIWIDGVDRGWYFSRSGVWTAGT